MQRASDGRLLVVCDTSVLINFLIVGRLDLLSQNPEFVFLVTEHALHEVTDPSQHEMLAQTVRQGQITAIEVNNPAELATFAELTRVLGSGEAAALAAASHRDLAVATDDGHARRHVENRLGPGRILTTPGILLKAIQGRVLTVSEADRIKAKLESRRFRMSFGSFADLV
jgi:predicted nucleic acid-binding protein